MKVLYKAKSQIRNLICVGLIQLVATTVANNDVLGQTVTARQLKETTVTYNRKKERIFCFGKTPGSIVTRSRKITFTSFRETLSKTPKNSTRRYNKVKALASLGKKECKRILNIKPGATPTPQPTATVAPTPTPVPGNFDNEGNVTEAGKVLFGIPPNLSANISRGRIVQQNKCTGCHVERVGWTFTAIRTNIKRPPMLFDEAQVPDPTLADLIAYLNRFRPT